MTAHLQHATWRALGTTVHLLVNDGDLPGARTALEQLLDDVDRTYSRFRPDSELVRLNATAGPPARVSALLAQAINVAILAARRTGGAVDPTVGRVLRLLGYDEDFAQIRESGARSAPSDVRVAGVPGWQAISVDRKRETVRLPSGVELDLGSTGKALAADLGAAASLAHAPDGGVLVSLGGDLVAAGRPPAEGWRVLAAEDSETPADAAGEVVAIEHGAIATSSTTVRRWHGTDGRSFHHLVDPRTGLPAESPWRTVSVVADTCVDANTAATAAIVMGDAGHDWLAATRLPARLVAIDGSIERLSGWPSVD